MYMINHLMPNPTINVGGKPMARIGKPFSQATLNE